MKSFVNFCRTLQPALVNLPRVQPAKEKSSLALLCIHDGRHMFHNPPSKKKKINKLGLPYTAFSAWPYFFSGPHSFILGHLRAAGSCTLERVDQPDIVMVHAAAAAIVCLATASTPEEVVYLQAKDGEAWPSLLPQGDVPRLLPLNARCRGLAPCPLDKAELCLAHVPAPDPTMVALGLPPNDQSRDVEFSLKSLPWITERIQTDRQRHAHTHTDRHRANDEEANDDEEDESGFQLRIPGMQEQPASAVAGKHRLITVMDSASPRRESGEQTLGSSATAALATSLQQHLQGLEASLRKSMQQMERRLDQRLERLELLLGLLIADKEAKAAAAEQVGRGREV